MSLLGYLSSPFLVGPLRRLATTARKFGEGHFEERADLHSGGEIRNLAEHFNRMADHIQKLNQNLSNTGKIHKLFPNIIVPGTLYAKIARRVRNNLGCDRVALLVENSTAGGENGFLRYIQGPEDQAVIKGSGVSLEFLDDLSELSYENDVNPLLARNKKSTELAGFFPGDDRPPSDALVFPLRADRDLGRLVLARHNRNFSATDIEIAENLLPQLATVISNARKFEEVLVDERRQDLSPVEDPDHFIVLSHDQSRQFLAILSGWGAAEIESVVEDLVRGIRSSSEHHAGVDAAAGVVAVEPRESTSALLERADRALNDARSSRGTRLWLEE